jgi:hypothetical protein
MTGMVRCGCAVDMSGTTRRPKARVRMSPVALRRMMESSQIPVR